MIFESQDPDKDHPLGSGVTLRPGSGRYYRNGIRLRAPAQAYLPPNLKADHLEADFSFYVEPKGEQQENGFVGRWCVAKANEDKVSDRKFSDRKFSSARMTVINADFPVVNYFIRSMLMASP